MVMKKWWATYIKGYLERLGNAGIDEYPESALDGLHIGKR